jgi:lysophospholipase L1-like esterase
VFVILAGTNNVGGNPPDDVAIADISRGIAEIVGRFRQHVPAAKVIVMGILPRGDDPAVISGISRINANIAAIADGKHVYYVDVSDRFLDADGKLIESLTMDKLHPNLGGYEVMAQGLKPLLAELLGSPAEFDRAPPPTGDPSAAR